MVEKYEDGDDFSPEELKKLDAEQEEAARWARQWTLARQPELASAGPPSISTFAQRVMCFDWHQPIDFTYRPWWPRIYDSEHLEVHLGSDGKYLRPKRGTFLLCARQVEKSTWMGTSALSLMALVNNLCVLYVSSALDNAREFADERVENPIRNSPGYQRYLVKGLSNARFGKRFATNSRIVIRAVKMDANRVRGIPADVANIDEIQHVNGDFIPDVLASTKNSELPGGPIYRLAGTPLTHDNITAVTWNESTTQNVWMTRCGSCNHWNPPHFEQIGRYGMICSKCGRAINPLTGQWVRGVSDPHRLDSPKISYEGFHLSQVMQPYTVFHDPEAFETRWRRLVEDINSATYTQEKIQNELIGIPWASGNRPITQEELEACCHPDTYFERVVPDLVRKDPDWPVFMGVDWGEGNPGGSFTVAHLGWMHAHGGGAIPRVAYAKRYEGLEAHPDFVKKDLVNLINTNKVATVFVDARHGWGMVDYLWDNVPDGRQRVILVDYADSLQTLGVYNKKEMRMSVNRTRWMSRVFQMIKARRIILPSWAQYRSPFGADILNIFADRSPKRRQMIYSHARTDDCFHSLSYFVLAAMLHYMGEDLMNS